MLESGAPPARWHDMIASVIVAKSVARLRVALRVPVWSGLPRSVRPMDYGRWAYEYFNHGMRWLQGDLWASVATARAPEEDVLAASAALRLIFPWEWVRKELARGKIPPVVRDHVLRGGVERLVRTGALLAQHQLVNPPLRKRLRNSPEYADCMAELRVGRLFSIRDAVLVFQPAATSGARGPDWCFRWPELEVSVEVKHPRPSQSALAASNVEVVFLFALQGALADAQLSAAAWVDFRLDPALVGRCATGAVVDKTEVAAAARAVAVEIKGCLRNAASPTQCVHVVDVAYARIELESGPPACQVSGIAYPMDSQHEVRRVRAHLQASADQLRGSPGLRVAALHLGGDTLLGTHRSDIAKILGEESWARDLDAVLLVDAVCRDLGYRSDLITRAEDRQRLSPLVRRLGCVEQ